MQNAGTRGEDRAARARTAFFAVALLLALVAAPHPAAAEKGEYVGLWTLSVQAGAAMPTTDEYGGSALWRIGAGYSFSPNFEVGLEWGRFSSEISQPDRNGIPTHTLASGDLDIRGFSAGIQWRRPVPELFSTLYLLGGVGYYTVEYSMAEAARAVYERSGTLKLPNQSVDDAWGAHLGGGLEYILTERLSLTGEVRYLLLAPDARGTTFPGMAIGGTIDLNTWTMTGGVKYAF